MLLFLGSNLINLMKKCSKKRYFKTFKSIPNDINIVILKKRLTTLVFQFKANSLFLQLYLKVTITNHLKISKDC